MKIDKLNFGVAIRDPITDLSDEQLKSLPALISREKVVVFKRQKMTLKQYDTYTKLWGIHRPAGLWCNHPDYPNLFRVTNKFVSPGKRGLAPGPIFDWHCSGMLNAEAEECVSLWCLQPGEDSRTLVADGVAAWQRLSRQLQELLEKVELVLTSRPQEAFSKRHCLGKMEDWVREEYFRSGHLNRRRPGEREAGESADRFYKRTTRKLVSRHPVTGEKGLAFPFLNVAAFQNLPAGMDQRELWETLIAAYVGEGARIYTHAWEAGDLLLMDQAHTLHKRNRIKGERELLRSAFWYRKG